MAARTSDRFLRNVTILLGFAAMAIGCGPASLSFLLLPFIDDRVEPKCQLAQKDKEIKIIIASRFQNMELRPDVQQADQELAEALATELRKRFKNNKEKVIVEPPLKVRPHLAKLQDWNATSLRQLGERMQADCVIALNIQSLSLVLPNSYPPLYKGRADVEVSVYDVHKDAFESEMFRQPFRCEYPAAREYDTTEYNPAQFRLLFNSRMARDLSRWFTAYPSDEKFDIN
jgi:hypothetical protein